MSPVAGLLGATGTAAAASASGPESELTVNEDGATAIGLDADGDRLAVANDTAGSITIYDVQTGDVRTSINTSLTSHGMELYLAGSTVIVQPASGDKTGTYAYDLDSGEQIWSAQVSAMGPYEIDRDAGILYSGDFDDGNLKSINISTGNTSTVHSFSSGYVRGVDVRADSVYFTHSDSLSGGVYRYDISTGNTSAVTTSDPVRDVAATSDTVFAATKVNDNSIDAIETSTGNTSWTLPADSSKMYYIGGVADGHLFAGTHDGVHVIDTSDGSVHRVVTLGDSAPRSIVQDGHVAIAQGTTVSVYDASDLTQYTITGTATTSDGETISNASITILQNGSQVAQTTTASDGTYSVTVPEGTYTVEATAPGYSTTVAGENIQVSSDTVQDATLFPGLISGTVNGADGTRVENANVEIVDSTGTVVKTTTTDTDGLYTVTPPDVATYDVRATADGYDTTTQTVDMTQGTLVDPITLAESTYSVDGSVQDTAGSAIENATVELTQNGSVVQSVTTGTDGNYTFSGVKSGDYTVSVAADGYLAADQTVSVSGDTSVDAFTLTATDTWTVDRGNETPDHAYLTFDSNGSATVTVEAYNNSSESWETVVSEKSITIENASADSPATEKVDLANYSESQYTKYRVSVDGTQTNDVGVATGGDGGSGLVPDNDDGNTLSIIVIGGAAFLIVSLAGLLLE